MQELGKHQKALLGSWNSGDQNPYGLLNLNRYRLQKVGELTVELMEKNLDLPALRAEAIIGSKGLQNQYDIHLVIAAMQLDGDESGYADLYQKAAEATKNKH